MGKSKWGKDKTGRAMCNDNQGWCPDSSTFILEEKVAGYKAHQQYCVQCDTGACTHYSKGWSVGCGQPHAENEKGAGNTTV